MDISEIITKLICSLIIVGGIVIFFLKHKLPALYNYGPMLLTTLGIFGTFLGITIGLMSFDPHDIDNSITNLLAGMQTAFITSLVGLIASMTFKTAQSIRSKFSEETSDLSINELFGRQELLLKELVKSIGGDEESSLSSQIKNMRMDLLDKFKRDRQDFETFSEKLWQSFEDFADKLSRSATDEVIKALNNVIQEFNEQLTEQFGENFKEFNQAVFKLVEWQEQYKEQLLLWESHYNDYTNKVDSQIKISEETINRLSNTSDVLENTSSSINRIRENIESIPKSMDQLVSIMNVHEKQIQELSNHLETFKNIKEKAENAFPLIENMIEKVINDMSNASNRVSNSYDNLIKETNDIEAALKLIINNFKDETTSIFSNIASDQTALMKKTFEGIENSLNTNILDMRNHLTNSIQDMTVEQTNNMNKMFSFLDVLLKEHITNSQNSMNQQLEIIDSKMQEEINRGMQLIGEYLGKISVKVAEEYNKMQNTYKNR